MIDSMSNSLSRMGVCSAFAYFIRLASASISDTVKPVFSIAAAACLSIEMGMELWESKWKREKGERERERGKGRGSVGVRAGE
jgi:hypothetical protein